MIGNIVMFAQKAKCGIEEMETAGTSLAASCAINRLFVVAKWYKYNSTVPKDYFYTYPEKTG